MWSGTCSRTARRWNARPLIEDLARIRDIETGPGGVIYLLLEHASGGQIVRMTPEVRTNDGGDADA